MRLDHDGLRLRLFAIVQNFIELDRKDGKKVLEVECRNLLLPLRWLVHDLVVIDAQALVNVSKIFAHARTHCHMLVQVVFIYRHGTLAENLGRRSGFHWGLSLPNVYYRFAVNASIDVVTVVQNSGTLLVKIRIDRLNHLSLFANTM